MKTAVIPAGFTVSGNTNESNIATGLVIYRIQESAISNTELKNSEMINWTDLTFTKNETTINLTEEYDQFVWIPIPKENIDNMFMCQSEGTDNITKSCEIELKEVNGVKKAHCKTHDSYNMAGRLYANEMFEHFDENLTTQTYTPNSGLREPAIVTDSDTGDGTKYDGATSTPNPSVISEILGKDTDKYDTAAHFLETLQNEYNAIVKSVYESEGFWVGRYETSGMDENVKVVAGTTNGLSVQTWYAMYGMQKKYAEDIGMLRWNDTRSSL